MKTIKITYHSLPIVIIEDEYDQMCLDVLDLFKEFFKIEKGDLKKRSDRAIAKTAIEFKISELDVRDYLKFARKYELI